MSEVMKVETNEFLELDTIEESLTDKHKKISSIPTPYHQIKKKAGFDYVEEGYMRNILNETFPIWNWEIVKYEILGDKWIIVHGKLTIIDHGIKRYYDSVAGHRIQRNRESGDYVDIGNDIKSANTDAFKVAVNRLCNIADDVYRKQMVDYNLTDKQISNIEEILSGIGDNDLTDKIKDEVDSLGINSQNYKATITKLNNIKES